MINYYDPNFQGVHVIRVTFMQWDYIRGWNSVWNRYGIDVFSISVPHENP